MAVKVTPARSMNMMGSKTYEEATGYKRDNAGYLSILKGTKKIAEHAVGTWESVEIFTPLDRKTRVTQKAKEKAPRFEVPKPPTTTKSAGKIRTSPSRGDGRSPARKKR